MNRLLVAVKSCLRDRDAGFHDAIRSTWGKDFGGKALVRFFIGVDPTDTRTARNLKSDEIVVDSKDDYMSLPHKTRGICKYAIGKMIDHIFLCDNDTFIKPDKLLAQPYELLDYGGHFKHGQSEVHNRFDYQDHMGNYPQCYSWASGGLGYFLSAKAAYEVAETYPTVWAEDMYVGQVVGPLVANGTFLAEHLDISNKATWHIKKTPGFPTPTPEIINRIYKDGSPDAFYQECLSK